LDDIAFFQTLNANQLSSIVTLQLTSLEERLKEHDIEITLTDKAIQSTLKKSYNPSNYFFNLVFSYLREEKCLENIIF